MMKRAPSYEDEASKIMKLYEKMRQQKLLSTTLLLVTLSVGILIGTLVNTGRARGAGISRWRRTRRRW